MSNVVNLHVDDVEMNDVYEEGERDEFPPEEFEAEEAEEERPRGGGSDDDEEGGAERKVKRTGAAKKIVKNPQAKLDDMRLCGQRGIPLLPKTFKNVKFRGKGHEVRDLDLFLSKMEHWGHRMFPKMVFDEVIDRCDRLYKTKKLVKTTLIRMRNGDNLLDDDDVAREGDDDFDDAADVLDEDDDFDDVAPILSSTMAPFDLPSQAESQTPAPDPPPVVLSDEIRERIEGNKRLAMERRRAREEALQAQPESTVSASEPQCLPPASNNRLGSSLDLNDPAFVKEASTEGHETIAKSDSILDAVPDKVANDHIINPIPVGDIPDAAFDASDNIAAKDASSTENDNDLEEDELLELINS